MIKNDGLIRSEMFYIEHLDPKSEKDISDISNFCVDDPKGQGLDIYLKEWSCHDEENKEMRTYLVRDLRTSELVGYFSLKAGSISLNEEKHEVKDSDTGENRMIHEFDTFPGVELANFAVNSNYIKAYPYQKGVGYVIFNKLIIPVINLAASYIGIKILYIFALPYEKLIRRYEDYGFKRLSGYDEAALHKRLKPRYDEYCKFMYIILEESDVDHEVYQMQERDT